MSPILKASVLFYLLIYLFIGALRFSGEAGYFEGRCSHSYPVSTVQAAMMVVLWPNMKTHQVEDYPKACSEMLSP